MKYSYLSLVLTILISLTGCGRKPIRLEPIKPLTAETSDFNQTKNNISVSIKKMTAKDSKHAFNGMNLLDKKVQPLQISIRNFNQEPIVVTQHDIGLTLINIEEFLDLFKQKNISAAGVVGLVAIGLVAGAVSLVAGFYLFAGAFIGTLPGALGLVGISMFYGSPALPIIVPVVGVVASSQSHNVVALQRAQTDGFIDQLIIEPHTTKDFLLLVKQADYKKQFALTVQHQHTNTSFAFDVILPEMNKKKLRI